MNDKPFWNSKKSVGMILGILAVWSLGITGNGDPSAYAAIGLIVSVALGAQGAADYKNVKPGP